MLAPLQRHVFAFVWLPRDGADHGVRQVTAVRKHLGLTPIVQLVDDTRRRATLDALHTAVDALWQRYSIARVAADPARLADAARPGGAMGPARWSYWRWHGSPRIYYSRYEDATLDDLAEALRHHGRVRSPAWCILDNTAHGHATEDAARLQERLARR